MLKTFSQYISAGKRKDRPSTIPGQTPSVNDLSIVSKQGALKSHGPDSKYSLIRFKARKLTGQ
jgi:hypothetical protein